MKFQKHKNYIKITVTKRVYKQLLGFGTGDTEALRQQVAADEFPFISASLSENLKNIERSHHITS